jgi:hypothetical protein
MVLPRARSFVTVHYKSHQQTTAIAEKKTAPKMKF